ncbi:MAG: DUF418 domain-containing protein [Magnetovibrio sp.]|nr:DUF418 domain-containing protein [Magnetovibrio sp.]
MADQYRNDQDNDQHDRDLFVQDHTRSGAAPDLRIVQLDVMRGVAVLGIYLVNVFVFGLPSTAVELPHLLGEAVTLNTTTWAISGTFIEGSMRGLFSILFGASTLVFLSEARVAEQGLAVVDRYYRRTILLMLFGMIHGFFLLNTLDVLYAYGLLGMFLFPLRRLGGYTLLAGALALLALSSVHVMSLSTEAEPAPSETEVVLSPESYEKFKGAAYEHMATEIEIYRTDYLTIFSLQFEDVIDQESLTMYTNHLFDIGGMMLIGMAMFKLGVLSGARSMLLYLGLAVFGYSIGGGMRGYGMYQVYAANFDPNMIQIVISRSFYDMDRLALTLGHVGVIGLICKAAWAKILTHPLAALGRMALTNYIAQTIISIFLFYGFGFGLFGAFERFELYGVVLFVWISLGAFSILWLKGFYLGPLEWVWRSLVYGTIQPLRRQRNT